LLKEGINDADILRMARNVRVLADTELDKLYPGSFPAIIEVKTKDGHRHARRVDSPRGDTLNPLSEEEVKQKFLRLTTPVLGEEKARSMIDMITHLERLTDCTGLVRILNEGVCAYLAKSSYSHDLTRNGSQR
jgi:2-methylcitrate dehydratase